MQKRTHHFVLFLALAFVVGLHADARAAKEQFQRSKPHVNIGTIGDGPDFGGFDWISGIGAETEVLDDPTGSDRKIPGRTTWSDITLKRGYTGAADVLLWAAEGVGGTTRLHDLAVDVLTPSAEPIARFNLLQCFPTRWSLDTTDAGRLEETLVVVCGKVEITSRD